MKFFLRKILFDKSLLWLYFKWQPKGSMVAENQQGRKLQRPRPIAHKIRELRLAKGWTLKDLADKVGVHLSHIQKIERGQRGTTLLVLLKIAEALEITSREIIDIPGVEFTYDPIRKFVVGKKTFATAKPIPLFSHFPVSSKSGIVEDHIFLSVLNKDFSSLPKGIKGGVAFALRVETNDMEPRFHKEDILIISPNAKLKDNITVVYRLKSGDCGIRIYRHGEGGQIILSNPDASELQVFESGDFIYIYPVVESLKKEY